MNLRKQLSSYITRNDYVEAVKENNSIVILNNAITDGLINLQITGSEVKNQPENIIPTPTNPLNIVCNKGILKASPNLIEVNNNTIRLGYYINGNTGIETQNGANFLVNIYIPVKPNTSYVAYGRRKIDNYLSQWNRIAWYDSNKNYIETSSYLVNTIGLGTSPSNAAYARFSCNPINTGQTITQEVVDSFNWIFGEGTQEYNKFIPHDTVITEGTPETIIVTGKNLYNVSKNINNKYISSSGSIEDDAKSCYSDLIPVKSGEMYTYSGICKSSSGTFDIKRIHGYIDGIWDQQIKTISADINTSFGDTFIIPTGINGIRISHWKDDEYTQVEESYRPTKYEDYYQTTFIPELLLKLGNYQDIQNVTTGIKSKKIGIKIFDGNENWQNIEGYIGISKDQLGTDSTILPSNSTDIICSHFEIKAGVFVDGCGVNDSYIIFKYDSLFTTITQWQQYLINQYIAGTPVIIVYPLADTIEENIESRDIFITSGTNVIKRNSEYVESGDIIVEYKKLR